MKLRRVANESLVDTVVHRLREFIDREKLTAGDRMPSEPVLISKLGVSRSVLREAVGRLQTIGLLDVQHGRGMFVASRDALVSSAQLLNSALSIAPQELVKFVEFRAVIEVHAARRVAEIATENDFAELERLCLEIDRDGQDYIASIRADFAFHFKFAEIAGNPLMQNVMRVLQEFIMAAMVNTTPQPRNVDFSRKIHRELLDAVRSRNANDAGTAMTRHMELSHLSLSTGKAPEEL
jgi:GntR family transcriptional repressor for pyruvate dehydrogenase complex